jgi:hypothetical protein
MIFRAGIIHDAVIIDYSDRFRCDDIAMHGCELMRSIVLFTDHGFKKINFNLLFCPVYVVISIFVEQ